MKLGASTADDNMQYNYISIGIGIGICVLLSLEEL